MKKRLLSFSMLILSIGLTTSALAQDDAGGSSFQGTDPVAGVIDVTVAMAESTPPSGVRHVKRNNGNASSVYGVAEARLHFTNTAQMSTNIKLMKVTDMNGIVVKDAVKDYPVVAEKGYLSYSLGHNVNPAKKLLFHFKNCETGATFCIPETN